VTEWSCVIEGKNLLGVGRFTWQQKYDKYMVDVKYKQRCERL
jgi:hypothetical protein